MKFNNINTLGLEASLTHQLAEWGINYLTEVQLKAIQAGVADGESMIVSAPTSSGKTLIGEISIAFGLRKQKRALYLVSHKSLADQKFEDFRRKFGDLATSPTATVGLATGDREEGEESPMVLVATYEKALSLMLRGEAKSDDSVIVLDELQIIGDRTRGPDIETLCTLLKIRGFFQLIGLTATVSNHAEISEWLGVQCVDSTKRDIDLSQEIWFGGRVCRVKFGESDEVIGGCSVGMKPDLHSTLTALLQQGRGPILVFTETRREAAAFASGYCSTRARVADGVAISEQLELFSEPTESSEQLRENAERRITFHTADLSVQERSVIERGFADSKFEVCFATSTLAAGVNFPFKTVVFPKITYAYGSRAGTMLSSGEYRNMSGRAGRLGMHDEGYAVILPQTTAEYNYARQLVQPANEAVNSQLVNLSLRRSVLWLVSAGVLNEEKAIAEFFEKTLFWHQLGDGGKKKFANFLGLIQQAVDWLIQSNLVNLVDGQLISTKLGKATTRSGLLPSTALLFRDLMKRKRDVLEGSFDDHTAGLIYWICSSPEFLSETPSRFLPYAASRSTASAAFLAGKSLFNPLDYSDDRLAQCAHALTLYVEGLAERKIAFATRISSGQLHRLAIDASWVLDGLGKLTAVPELECPQQLANRFSMLARRIRWGAPAEVVDMIRVAEGHGVPGFGRQRAMALLSQGLTTFESILSLTKDKLVEILRHEGRVNSLLSAISNAIGFSFSRAERAQLKLAKQLGLDELVDQCHSALGAEYEAAILALLRQELTWSVTALDDGKRQNVPDILLSLADFNILLECKTCAKQSGVIKKEEAFAVMQKSCDFDPLMARVTLGKPAFDEHSKSKVQGARGVTLVEHHIFIEGVLRVHSGAVSPAEFVRWLSAPGLSDINRLNPD